MSDLKTRFENFVEEYDGNPRTDGVSLYEDMPNLYDGFYAKHYDYTAQADLIDEYTELSPGSTVVEGACGTGRLLAQLETKYETIGFDMSPEMLQIASENTDNSILMRSRLEEFFIPEPVDGFFVLGNALYHLSGDERKQFFEQAYENMSNQSTFIFSFMDENEFEDGHSGADVYSLADWKIRRNVISVDKTDSEVTSAFSYRVSDSDDDYKRLQVGFSMDGYVHNPQEIDSELTNLGFTNITIMKPDDIPHTVCIARKVS